LGKSRRTGEFSLANSSFFAKFQKVLTKIVHTKQDINMRIFCQAYSQKNTGESLLGENGTDIILNSFCRHALYVSAPGGEPVGEKNGGEENGKENG